MNQTEAYIANQIRLSVWSGVAEPEDVQEIITDILEEAANEEMLRALVAEEFARKAEAEKSWPEVTDVDRLAAALERLNDQGIVAIHNAGWDKSEGFHRCLDTYRSAGSPQELFGICYYTSQDINSAIDGKGIYLGYSSTRAEDEETDALKTAELICAEVKTAGLNVEWCGDTNSRIKVDLKWQLRG